MALLPVPNKLTFQTKMLNNMQTHICHWQCVWSMHQKKSRWPRMSHITCTVHSLFALQTMCLHAIFYYTTHYKHHLIQWHFHRKWSSNIVNLYCMFHN